MSVQLGWPRGHGRERPGKMAQNPIGHDEGMEWEAIKGFIQGNNIIQFMFLKASSCYGVN